MELMACEFSGHNCGSVHFKINDKTKIRGSGTIKLKIATPAVATIKTSNRRKVCRPAFVAVVVVRYTVLLLPMLFCVLFMSVFVFYGLEIVEFDAKRLREWFKSICQLAKSR